MVCMKCPCAYRLRRLAHNEALIQNSCQEGDGQEILPRDLLVEILFRDLAKRPLPEIANRALVQILNKISPRDLSL